MADSETQLATNGIVNTVEDGDDAETKVKPIC